MAVRGSTEPLPTMVTCEPRGRNLIYRADFVQMNALLAYLTEHCCQGSECAVATQSRALVAATPHL